jgi:serine phosphatase RsbU (regulator of sigma subunit)
MQSSYPVACPHANCGWAGNPVLSLLREGPDAEIVSMHRAWFRCPRCQGDWEVRITNDRVVVLPVEQASPFQPAAVPDLATPDPSPWQRVERLIREIGGHFLRVPEDVRDGEGGAARRLLDLQLLLEQLPTTLKALRQTHDGQHELVAARTAELSEANAELRKEIADSAQAKRRLGTEHTVARILAESSGLPNVAAMILQSICQSLGWVVGAFWAIDPNAQVLRCIDVWHAPMVDITEFERTSRQHACAPGIGLPGRIWASGSPVWLSDVTQEAFLPRAPVAAREGLRAAVGFPIHSTEFLGVMEFFSQEIRRPDKELLQMMTSIGRHIGQFIERLTAEEGLFQKETELLIAKKIQQRLVAKAAPALNGFDIAGASHSAAETGGDYFEFFPLLDSCQGIVIADACGHGLGPALLVTETRAYLRAFAMTSEDIGRTLALVNDRLVEDTGGDSFVTLFLARLDPRTYSLLYSSAGNPKGCILDHSGSVKAFLQSTGPPLGIIPDCKFPIGSTIVLEPGDLVLLFTDGVIEARAPDNTVFGSQRASDIVRVYRGDTSAQIVYNLYHAVRVFSHNRPQADDITVVVIKVRKDAPSSHAALAFADHVLSGDGPAPTGSRK